MNTDYRHRLSLPADPPRTPAGAVDHEAVTRAARRLRGEALAALIGSLYLRVRLAAAAAIRSRGPGVSGHRPRTC